MKMLKSIIMIGFITSIISAGINPAYALGPPEIRVLIIESADSITVEGMGYKLQLTPVGRKKSLPLKRMAKITAGKEYLAADNTTLSKSIVINSKNGRYRIERKEYRGSLEAHWISSGKLMLINVLPLEKYLIGIIGSEISPSWPVETMKAQAVAARTYAMNKIRRSRKSTNRKPYDITSNIFSQVYHGSHVEDSRAEKAVRQTYGMVIYRNGSLHPSFYHSCCGGQTEYAHNVWENAEDSPIVRDKFCRNSPKMKWRYTIAVNKFLSALKRNGLETGNLLSLEIINQRDSPRVEHLLIEDDRGLNMISATKLRRIFGYGNIKSTWFEVAKDHDEIVFSGRGYGHGVGMCQWGAKGMAEAGHNYREILKYYYADSKLRKAY